MPINTTDVLLSGIAAKNPFITIKQLTRLLGIRRGGVGLIIGATALQNRFQWMLESRARGKYRKAMVATERTAIDLMRARLAQVKKARKKAMFKSHSRKS